MGFCWRALAIGVLLGLSLVRPIHATDWQTTITTSPPGPFALPRPFRATYRFGWSGFTAAAAEINFARLPDARLRVEGTGRTTGLVRTLWKMDVNLTALADGKTLRPIEARQIETTRSKKIATHLAFDARGVTRSRTEGAAAPKLTRFDFPNLYDLQSALLYLRSQPLATQNVQRIVVYPTTSPYLATLTVLGREKISVGAGTYDAIKFDLKLSKVGKNNELQPHRKFRRATAWISDDADRLLLRVNAQIFVGTVFLELQSARFEDSKQ
jgi:hypothetical protein